MNERRRNEIRIGVGGILFAISILLPKLLDSYALVRATCAPPLPEDTSIKAQCETQAIGTIPVFTMAIAFSTALMVLFFVSMLSPTIGRFNRFLTDPGTDSRATVLFQIPWKALSLSKIYRNESQKLQRYLPPLSRYHPHCSVIATL